MVYPRRLDTVPCATQTHSHREQIYGCQGAAGEGEGRTGSLGLVDANYYI